MIGTELVRSAGPSGPLVRFLFLTLIAVALVLPPETRGESAAGCAVLLLLLPLLLHRDAARIGSVVACAAAAAALMALPSIAPAAAVAPLSVGLAALVLGGLGTRRCADLGGGPALPAVLAGVGAVVSAHALYQYFWGLKAGAALLAGMGVPEADAALTRLREGRPFAAFATPAALGGFVVLALPITIGFALERRGRTRALLVGAALLECAALAASASGTAVAALAGGTAIVLFRRRLTRGFVLPAAVVAVLALVAAVVAARGLSVLDLSNAEGPWRLRAGNVRAAAAMLADHPFAGVGPGAYGEAFPQYRRAGDNESRHAHNLPAELLAETGAIAGATLSVIFFAWFLAPAWRRESAAVGWKAGAAAGLAAFALQNLADFTAFFPSLLWSAAILRGSLARPAATERGGSRGTVPALAAVAVTLAACVACALNGLSWNALVECREFAAAGGRREAVRLAERAVRLAPWQVDPRLQRAGLTLDALLLTPDRDAERWNELLVEADVAVRLSPLRPAARALRARVRLGTGDLPGAYADLREAARLYPLESEYARQRDEVARRLPRAGKRSS